MTSKVVISLVLEFGLKELINFALCSTFCSQPVGCHSPHRSQLCDISVCPSVYHTLDVTSDHSVPLTSTWPHLRCDVGLDEGDYRENCLCVAVLCTIIMVHEGTSSFYR